MFPLAEFRVPVEVAAQGDDVLLVRFDLVFE
jgi:hypothetical protein